MPSSLSLPDTLAAKAVRFPECSYGATRVTLVLRDGRRIRDVILAGGVEIVRVGGQDVAQPSDLAFAMTEICAVRHQKRPTTHRPSGWVRLTWRRIRRTLVG